MIDFQVGDHVVYDSEHSHHEGTVVEVKEPSHLPWGDWTEREIRIKWDSFPVAVWHPNSGGNLQRIEP